MGLLAIPGTTSGRAQPGHEGHEAGERLAGGRGIGGGSVHGAVFYGVIVHADRAPLVDEARTLFGEYADSLGIDLSFQNFEEERRELPGDYAPPRGVLLLAVEPEGTLGCAALRPVDAETAEMKRLYLRPAARGRGLGRSLAEAILAEARRLGYRRIRLDTLPGMESAQALYRALGFRVIPAYTFNPIPGTLFMECDL